MGKLRDAINTMLGRPVELYSDKTIAKTLEEGGEPLRQWVADEARRAALETPVKPTIELVRYELDQVRLFQYTGVCTEGPLSISAGKTCGMG